MTILGDLFFGKLEPPAEVYMKNDGEYRELSKNVGIERQHISAANLHDFMKGENL